MKKEVVILLSIFFTILLAQSIFSYTTPKLEAESDIDMTWSETDRPCDSGSVKCVDNGFDSDQIGHDCRCRNTTYLIAQNQYINADEVSGWGAIRIKDKGKFRYPAINTVDPNFIEGNYYFTLRAGFHWHQYQENMKIINNNTGETLWITRPRMNTTEFITCTVPKPMYISAGDRIEFRLEDSKDWMLDYFVLSTESTVYDKVCDVVESTRDCYFGGVNITDTWCTGPANSCVFNDSVNITTYGVGSSSVSECGDFKVQVDFVSSDGDCTVSYNGNPDIYGAWFNSKGSEDGNKNWFELNKSGNFTVNVTPLPVECRGDYMCPTKATLFENGTWNEITTAQHLEGGFRFDGATNTSGPPIRQTIDIYGSTDNDTLVRIRCDAVECDPDDHIIGYSINYSTDNQTWQMLEPFTVDGTADWFTYNLTEGKYYILCEAIDNHNDRSAIVEEVWIDHNCDFDYCEYFTSSSKLSTNDANVNWDTGFPALYLNYVANDSEVTSKNYKSLGLPSFLSTLRGALISVTEITQEIFSPNKFYLARTGSGGDWYQVQNNQFFNFTGSEANNRSLRWAANISAISDTPYITRIGLNRSKCIPTNIVVDDSLCTGPSGGCVEGDLVLINPGDITGTCPFPPIDTLLLHVDLNDSEYNGTAKSGCDIQDIGGDMQGLSVTCNANNCVNTWTVPEVPYDCKGKLVTPREAALYETVVNPNYHLGNTFSGVSGSIQFEDFYCGDGNVSPGETCDGTDWGQNVTGCTSLGFTGGTLGCYAAGHAKECLFNTTQCTGNPFGSCGDGTINVGEACDGSNLGSATDCSFFSPFTHGNLSCYPSTSSKACQFNTTECLYGGVPITYKCGKPVGYYNGTDIVNITEISNASMTCDDDFTSPVIEVCSDKNDCVYGDEANQTNPPTNAQCYRFGDIITNQVGNRIKCEGENTWCPDYFLWNPITGQCEENRAVCDWGFEDNTQFGCEQLPGSLYTKTEECVADYVPPAENTPWTGACCTLVNMSKFLLMTGEDVKVY